MGEQAVIEFKNFVHTKIVPLISISEITTIFFFEFTNTFAGPTEMHEMWELVYVCKGTIIQSIENKKYTMHEGDYVFIPPNEVHQLSAHPDSFPNVFITSFMCSSEAMNIFKRRAGNLPEHLRAYITNIISETSSFSQIFHPFYNRREAQDLLPSGLESSGSQQMICSYLEQLLIHLYRSIAARSESPSSPLLTHTESRNSIVNKAATYIRDNVYTPLTVCEVCSYVGYSNSHLSALFTKYCGCTISEYINRMKIDSAKALIRRGATNFTEIAAMLCYSDQHYFSRVFRRVTGMSPSEYRKSIQL